MRSASVLATVESHCRAEKLIVFKMKKRKNYRRTQGHRHEMTVLRIDKIKHALEEAEEANTLKSDFLLKRISD